MSMTTTTATSSSTRLRTSLRSSTSGTRRKKAETAWKDTTTSSFPTKGCRRSNTTWMTTQDSSLRSPTLAKPSSMRRNPTNTEKESRRPEENSKSPKCLNASPAHLSFLIIHSFS